MVVSDIGVQGQCQTYLSLFKAVFSLKGILNLQEESACLENTFQFLILPNAFIQMEAERQG